MPALEKKKGHQRLTRSREARAPPVRAEGFGHTVDEQAPSVT